MSETFEGISYGGQDKRKCTLFLQLSKMKTSRGITGKYKPTNTELPSPVRTDGEIIVSATVNQDGNPITYTWEKNHGGKIAKVEIKAEPGQLKVTLTKAEQTDWGESYLDYLQDL